MEHPTIMALPLESISNTYVSFPLVYVFTSTYETRTTFLNASVPSVNEPLFLGIVIDAFVQPLNALSPTKYTDSGKTTDVIFVLL